MGYYQSAKNTRGCWILEPGDLPYKNRSLNQHTLNSGFDTGRKRHKDYPGITHHSWRSHGKKENSLSNTDLCIACSNRDFFIGGQEREVQSCLCVFSWVKQLRFLCVPGWAAKPWLGSQVKPGTVPTFVPLPVSVPPARFAITRWFTEVPYHFNFPKCLLLALPPSVDSSV